ncbi:MAG: serine--tRNA ligase [Desulfoplanes sp.]|nr:serine--tRNA ligase [Desulfoplanes sp.]MDD4648870.1 serine--tRNA ligase [Desulfoplanes sp.]
MLDIKFLRSQLDQVKSALRKRHSTIDLESFLKTDVQRRSLLQEVEELKGLRNKTSAEVAQKKRNNDDVSELLEQMASVSKRIKVLDGELKEVDTRTREFLLTIPNIPHGDVPVGRDENDNRIERFWGKKPTLDFPPKEHWELGTDLGGLDFPRATKLTGSRFVVLKGWAARMERALINFMIDVHTHEHGYTEIMPPVIVNKDSLLGTGQLPKFAEDLFKLENSDYYLIPTAEVPLTNLFRDEILNEEDLPCALTAFTPCFRSEAGSYGKDTKGIIRQHQFDKVEMVRIAHPDHSYEDLELLVGHAEDILQKLGLHYRVVTLCTGDLGFSAAKTYDIEVWLPGQNKYREISSCSNCEDFQGRRANIRFNPKGSTKKLLVHTLNGSGLAVGRTMVAIIENYQQKDGSVVIPDVLRPYMDGIDIIQPR